MPTYTLLSETVVSGSTTATVTISGISQAYTDLVIRASTRGNNNLAPYDYLSFTFNNTTGPYSYHVFYVEGSGGTNQTNATGQSNTQWNYYAAGSTAGTQIFGGAEIYIPNYTASTIKTFYVFGGFQNNATTNSRMNMGSGYYTPTSAITRIDFTNVSSTYFVANSRFQVYGISNA